MSAPLDPPPQGYRPCVGVALFNRDGLVFVGRRSGIVDGPGAYAWQMPQGGVDGGETPRQAAIRELREETGVVDAELVMEAPGWLAYDLPEQALKPSWRGRYRGQAQRWFAFRLLGDERQVDIGQALDGHGPEFDAWRWERLENTPELVVPFKREVYRRVAKTFAGL